MNRLIMCEGKTDAILLGYYLMKVAGWEFSSSGPSGLKFKIEQNNEIITWYQKGAERLMICAVGGKDNFKRFFSRGIESAIRNSSNEDPFSRVVIITDRDDREIAEVEKYFAQTMAPFFLGAQNNTCNVASFTDSYGIEKKINTLLMVIPVEYQGALETIMLKSISEDPYDKNIVDKCIIFINEIQPYADKYLSTSRLQLKSKLSAVWAVQSPEKVFDFIDSQIKSVNWEKYSTLRECFVLLESI